jgi:hypothetical protein
VSLNTIQKELIAKLPDHPAYALLLDLMKSEIDVVAMKMEVAKTEKEALWSLQSWRALRNYHRILSTHPEQLETEIEDMLEAKMEAMGGEYFPPAFVPDTPQRKFPWADPYVVTDEGED